MMKAERRMKEVSGSDPTPNRKQYVSKYKFVLLLLLTSSRKPQTALLSDTSRLLAVLSIAYTALIEDYYRTALNIFI